MAPRVHLPVAEQSGVAGAIAVDKARACALKAKVERQRCVYSQIKYLHFARRATTATTITVLKLAGER